MLAEVCVVVPAHNEERHLAACLSSVRDSLDAAQVRGRVIVVLDSCSDRTASVARIHGADAVILDARNVGAARHAGVVAALARARTLDWIATTDADSTVGRGWIAGHLAHADAGADVVAGTVTVDDWSGWPAHIPVLYRRLYAQGVRRARHRHVHGANLSFSPRAYRMAGGFPRWRTAEDHGLIAAARRAGLAVIHAVDVPVVTSARRVGRVDHGFAGYLRSVGRPDGYCPFSR